MTSEFDFIRNIKAKFGLGRVGDDCAVLPKDEETDMVVTADMLVEDVDFRLEWTSPELLGRKVLAVSLSDIAAMGARPTWAMLSLAVTDAVWNGDFLEKFYEGWFTLAHQHDVELVGGDVSRIEGKVVFDSIVGGETRKGWAVLRSGAKPGDSIYVTGTLGGAAGGLMMLQSGFEYRTADGARRELIAKHLRPLPRIEIGRTLGEMRIASAMIDLSDGISSDLGHICEASNFGARLSANEIPICPELFEIGAAPDQALALALNGGEDFELLFTSPEKDLSERGIEGVQRIGEITANSGVIEVIGGGEFEILKPGGYRHF